MDKFQAGFEILSILSMIDGEVHDKEIEVINGYVASNLGKSSYDSRAIFKSLLVMTAKGRIEELAKAAITINETCSSLEKNNLFESALALIAADGVLRDEEAAGFVVIGNTWGIDVKAFLAQYK